MLGLVFIILFSLIANLTYSFDIYGDFDKSIKNKIKYFAEKKEYDNIRLLLNSLNIKAYDLSDNSLIIYKSTSIDTIKLHGNLNFLDSTIISSIGFYQGTPVYLTTFDEYKNRIIKFYKNKGFLDIKVSYRFDKNRLDFYIDEGKLYVLNKVAIFYNNKEVDSEVLINPKILTPELVEKMKNKFIEKIKLKGDLFPDYQIYYEKANNRIFFHLDSPTHSAMSLIPYLHKNINLEIKINGKKKFKFYIKGLSEQQAEEAKEIIVRNLEKLDSFNMGKTYVALINKFGEDTYFDINEDTIRLEVKNYEERPQYVFKVKSNKYIKVDDLQENLNREQKEKLEDIKQIIKSFLERDGFYKFDLSISKTNNVFNIEILLFDRVSIDKVYLNNTLFIKNAKKKYESGVNNILVNEIKNRIRGKYFFRYVLEDKVVYNKSKNTVDLYFKSDLKEIFLRDIITADNKTKNRISKIINSGEKITVEKLDRITYYFKNTLNITNYSLNILEDGDVADIVFTFKETDRNLVFFDIQYSNIDGITTSIGYKRYNIFSSDFVLNLTATLSRKEEDFLVGFSKFSKLNSYQLKLDYSFNYFQKDMSDFKYKGGKLGFSSDFIKNKIIFNTGMFYEKLKIYNSDYTNYDFNKRYKILKIPINFSLYSNKMLEDYYALNLFNKFLISNNFLVFQSDFNFSYLREIFERLYGQIDINFGKFIGNTTDIPVLYRFTLGGPDKMKAFSVRELGCEDSDGNVYGGSGYYHVNLETPIRLVKNVYLGPFMELGQVFTSNKSTSLYKDIGLAFKVDMLIGDISVSYAKSFKGWGKRSDAFYVNLKTKF